MDSINGIALSAISKINGIAKSALSKINGIVITVPALGKGIRLVAASSQYLIVEDNNLDTGFICKSGGSASTVFTVGVTLRLNTLPTSTVALLTKTEAGSTRSFRGYINSTVEHAMRFDGGAVTEGASPIANFIQSDVDNGVVKTIIMVVDCAASGSNKLLPYTDGISDGTSDMSSSSAGQANASSAALCLGARDTPTPDSFLDATIQNAFVCNTLLSQSDITDIENNGVTSAIPNLQARWDFGTETLLDQEGSNDWTAVGSPIFEDMAI